jgi:cytochrome c oxidase subunit 1
MHWNWMNALASVGVVFMTAGLLVFLANVARSRQFGQVAGNNPWGASELEWSTSSPPPTYNFLHPPTVNGRDALWDALPDQPVVVGLRDDIRQTLVTHSLDANPQHKDEDPGPSIWPFLAALAVSGTFVGSIFTPWAVPVGAPPVIVTLIGWLKPRGHSPTPLQQEALWER